MSSKMDVFAMGEWFATESWDDSAPRLWTINANGAPVEMFLRKIAMEKAED